MISNPLFHSDDRYVGHHCPSGYCLFGSYEWIPPLTNLGLPASFNPMLFTFSIPAILFHTTTFFLYPQAVANYFVTGSMIFPRERSQLFHSAVVCAFTSLFLSLGIEPYTATQNPSDCMMPMVHWIGAPAEFHQQNYRFITFSDSSFFNITISGLPLTNHLLWTVIGFCAYLMSSLLFSFQRHFPLPPFYYSIPYLINCVSLPVLYFLLVTFPLPLRIFSSCCLLCNSLMVIRGIATKTKEKSN